LRVDSARYWKIATAPAPAERMSSQARVIWISCSRQKGQPKWRMKATISGPSRQRSSSSTGPPTVASVTFGKRSPGRSVGIG